jgi:hypothetical protein
MKWISLLLFVCLLLSACSHNAVSDVVTEQVPIDYGKVIELAQKEFNAVFDEFTNLKIQETKTATRAGNVKHFIIEITYSSDNGNGVYGLEYLKDDYGNYELLQQGENVSVYNLVKDANENQQASTLVDKEIHYANKVLLENHREKV